MTLQRIAGFCALCRSRCGCVSTVEDGRLVAVDPDPSHPTGRSLCVKGRAAPELVYANDRLLFPMKRTRPKSDLDAGWVRIGWGEALAWTAGRMRAAADRHGPEAVTFAVTTPSGTAVSDGFPWINRLIRLFGSPNMTWAEELCAWHRDYVTAYTFGVDIGTPDFPRTGCMLLWGHNPSTSYLAQATAVAEARARGAALIVVDPRRAGAAVKADQWLRVRPGTDGALALGLAGVMLAEGRYDSEFIRHWSNGPFLVRDDTDRFLTAAELQADGDAKGYVVWDRPVARPIAYDPAGGRFVDDVEEPLLLGRVRVATRTGPVECRPAFERYAALCREYTPERVARVTGVPVAQIVDTARLLWERRPVAYFHWTGLEQHTNATQTVRAISLLYALTGSWDAPGGNVRPSRPPVNDLGALALLPEGQLAKALGLAERPLGIGRHGWVLAADVYRAIVHGTPYPVRGMVGFGGNLLMSQPGAPAARDALTRLDFMVWADLFLTPTAALADVVLPVSSAWEREGLRVGFGPTHEGETLIQLRPPVVAPRGEARSDTWIACELAKRLGLGEAFFGGEVDAGHRFMLEPSGVTLEALRASSQGVRVPAEIRYRRHAARQGDRVAGFATPSRRVEIYASQFLDHGYAPLPDYVEPAVSPVSRPDLAARYPLVLTSAKVVQFCHSQHRSLPRLRRHSPDPLVELHPSAAGARGIAPDDWVVVETPRATMRARAKLNATLAPGVVWAQFGWWQACEPLGLPGYDADGAGSASYNNLIDADAADPISGTTALRSYLCEVRPAGS
ncbi:MAG TPA: molybdopterin-dependent oxidoreductase [Methylomirabilota bacterium]|nr:molybdopterin-dependent oxidoreductase [Methylomirabilota bacterium]